MKFAIACVVMIVAVTAARLSPADDSTGDANRSTKSESHQRSFEYVQNVIFDDSFLAQNVQQVCDQTRSLPSLERYRRLSDWVLPSDSHNTIRLTAEFAGLNSSLIQRHDRAGHNIVSPVLDLVAVATELHQLSALRQRISNVVTDSDIHQRSQLALLGLVDIAAEDFDAALDRMNDLLDRHRERVYPELHLRWPETLVAAEAIHHAPLHEVADQLLQRMLREQVRRGTNNGPNPWDRLIVSLVGQLRRNQQTGNSDSRAFSASLALREWFEVSPSNFGTHGLGHPVAHWERNGSTLHVLSHHDDDFLYLRTPLTGDYEIECDVGAFDYRDTCILAGGLWVQPRFTLEEFYIGTIRDQLPRGQISPRLSEMGDWGRMRISMKDGTRTTFVNGRTIHAQKSPEHSDPWVAIRVPFHTHGIARDIAISGQPTIPDTIDLSSDQRLTGWTSYFGGDVGTPEGDWRYEIAKDGTAEIVGRHADEFAGAGKESLLRYHRPVIEDGVIEYEFYFEPKVALVHPAIGRRVILVNPAGVTTHNITDGHFDRTGADPLATTAIAAPQISDLRGVLKPKSWNRARLQLSDNVITLAINGHHIYQAPTADLNGREFGLFHYAGDTVARVRNVRWTGDWPKTLPDIADQELRDTIPAELDSRLADLPAVFEHDFATDGLPRDRFMTFDRGAEEFVTVDSDGLHVDAKKSGAGYTRACVSPRLLIHGDFDITATATGLKLSATKHGKCDAILQIALTDDDTSHHAVGLCQIVDPNKHPRHVVEHQLVQLNPVRIQTFGTRAEESVSARFRLARRGNKIYSLLAAADSATFRVIHVADAVPDSSRYDGIRLNVGMNSSVPGDSRVRVTWKNLVVRAEHLAGPASLPRPDSD